MIKSTLGRSPIIVTFIYVPAKDADLETCPLGSQSARLWAGLGVQESSPPRRRLQPLHYDTSFITWFLPPAWHFHTSLQVVQHLGSSSGMKSYQSQTRIFKKREIQNANTAQSPSNSSLAPWELVTATLPESVPCKDSVQKGKMCWGERTLVDVHSNNPEYASELLQTSVTLRHKLSDHQGPADSQDRFIWQASPRRSVGFLDQKSKGGLR